MCVPARVRSQSRQPVNKLVTFMAVPYQGEFHCMNRHFFVYKLNRYLTGNKQDSMI